MAGGYFTTIRSEIAPLLPRAVHRVLDVGCGTGATSAWLKTIYPAAYLIGLEGNPALRAELAANVDEGHIVDLDGPLPDIGTPDLVLLLDVLEHLARPERVLADVVARMSPDATVIISLPNIAHLAVAAKLLFLGRFDYSDAGILDRTHLHFYYRDSAVRLIRGAGLEVDILLRGGFDGPKTRMLDRLTLGLMR